MPQERRVHAFVLTWVRLPLLLGKMAFPEEYVGDIKAATSQHRFSDPAAQHVQSSSKHFLLHRIHHLQSQQRLCKKADKRNNHLRCLPFNLPHYGFNLNALFTPRTDLSAVSGFLFFLKHQQYYQVSLRYFHPYKSFWRRHPCVQSLNE